MAHTVLQMLMAPSRWQAMEHCCSRARSNIANQLMIVAVDACFVHSTYSMWILLAPSQVLREEITWDIYRLPPLPPTPPVTDVSMNARLFFVCLCLKLYSLRVWFDVLFWALVSEPGFLKFQISRILYSRDCFFGKYFRKICWWDIEE